jgi:hypothetical protein
MVAALRNEVTHVHKQLINNVVSLAHQRLEHIMHWIFWNLQHALHDHVFSFLTFSEILISGFVGRVDLSTEHLTCTKQALKDLGRHSLTCAVRV